MTLQDWDAAAPQRAQIAAHDDPIRYILCFTPPGADAQMVVTGLWEKTIMSGDYLRTKLPPVGGIISTSGVSRNGTIMSSAVSYDWSRGHQYNAPTYPNKIMLLTVGDDEARPAVTSIS
ncbi:hypothetical protein HOY80DRAFT_1047439 [Tuber brumale]|nr:hypothetical protein HOY80DRAFT_1047439 [Tuber brumale]